MQPVQVVQVVHGDFPQEQSFRFKIVPRLPDQPIPVTGLFSGDAVYMQSQDQKTIHLFPLEIGLNGMTVLCHDDRQCRFLINGIGDRFQGAVSDHRTVEGGPLTGGLTREDLRFQSLLVSFSEVVGACHTWL